MTKPTSEEEAVRAALQRSADSPARFGELERIFALHHDRVFRVAFRVTGNAMDAEDVLQTIFLRLLRREDQVPLGEGVGSYLHRAAVNAGLDLLRRKSASRSTELDLARPLADPAPGPDSRRAGAEIRDRLRAALARMNPRAAEIFTLRYIEGCGNREIARMLGTSWSTVAVTLHRTRARLRKEILGGGR